jgi:hypothetical protein
MCALQVLACAPAGGDGDRQASDDDAVQLDAEDVTPDDSEGDAMDDPPDRDSLDALESPDLEPEPPLPWPDCEELGWGPREPFPDARDRTEPRFDDVTSLVGLPSVWGITASWGDINGDRVPDLFVPGHAKEQPWTTIGPRPPFQHTVWINCAGTLHEVDLLPRWEELEHFEEASASHIADIDRDGMADLVIATPRHVYIGFQRADGRFDSVWVVDGTDGYSVGRVAGAHFMDLVVADLNGDALLDIYVSNFVGVDPVLQNVGGRSFEERAFDSRVFVDATKLETYATSIIFGPPGREHPLIYVGNHGELNWLFRVEDDFRLVALVDDHYPFATMGVDFQHLDGGVRTMLTTTDTSQIEASVLEQERIYGSPTCTGFVPGDDSCGGMMFGQQGWGLRLEDYNNDGSVDLAMAHGYQSPDPEFVDEVDTPNFDSQRLVLARIEEWGAEGGLPLWTVENSETGPHFDGSIAGHYYGVATVDFDLDGCVDLMVTPFGQESYQPPRRLYAQPILLLRNSCGYPGDWIGFWMHDDPGALLTVTIDYGEEEPVRRIREVRASAAIACESASEQVHVGLGDGATVMSVEIICRDGRTTTIDGADLEVGQYNDVTHVCAPPV